MITQLILLGSLTITAYQARPQDTRPECKNNHECVTSIGENVNGLGCAVSQDLLKSGRVHYRDVLWIPGVGYRIVFDTMHPRIHNAIDVFVYDTVAERKIGVRHSTVYLIVRPSKTEIAR